MALAAPFLQKNAEHVGPEIAEFLLSPPTASNHNPGSDSCGFQRGRTNLRL